MDSTTNREEPHIITIYHNKLIHTENLCMNERNTSSGGTEGNDHHKKQFTFVICLIVKTLYRPVQIS